MIVGKIDWGTIAELLWAAPLAGIAVSLSFAILMVGVTRAGEARRAGASGLSTLYSGMAVLAALAFAAVVAYGIEIITTK